MKPIKDWDVKNRFKGAFASLADMLWPMPAPKRSPASRVRGTNWQHPYPSSKRYDSYARAERVQAVRRHAPPTQRYRRVAA